MLLQTNGSMKKSKRISEKTSRQMNWRHNYPKAIGCNRNSSKREIYSDTGLPQQTRKKSQVNNLTFHLEELEKKNKAQSQQKE